MSEASKQRNPVEELAAEFVERCRRGEFPSIEEYAESHPKIADEIRELFPAVLAMEGLKTRKEEAPGTAAGPRPGQPEQLGDFRIIREIGRGGMGVVYEAEQESLGRRVAIKVLRRTAMLSDKEIRRFEREARVAAGLHHTNIVQVFGVGEQDDYLYYVMELIRGVGLDEVITRLREDSPGKVGVTSSERTETFTTEYIGLPESEDVTAVAPAQPQDRTERVARLRAALEGPSRWQNVAGIGLQVARALEYAHGQGAVHRDIKPSNLLLDEKMTVWVADFGLAKAPHTEDLTLTGDLAGTLRYMAPEQFRGRADFRSDIYALGLTLYELLARRPAYENPNRTSLIHAIMHGEPQRPGKSNPDVPRDLETIVLKAISHEPAQRYDSAGEMAEDLERFRADRPITARRISSLERTWRWARRNPAVAALATSTLVLLLVVATVATAGYLRTREALRGEARERRRAEANAELAVGALDRMFERLAPGTRFEITELSTENSETETLTIPSPPVLSDETVALLEEMLTYYERLATRVGDETRIRLKIAEANCRVGEIRRRLGQYDRAVKAYHRGLEVYAELLDSGHSKTALRIRMAGIHNELGQTKGLNQQPRSSRQSHQQALQILQPVLSRSPDNTEAQFELARTHYFLGLPGMAGAAAGAGPVSAGPGPGRGRTDDEGTSPRGPMHGYGAGRGWRMRGADPGHPQPRRPREDASEHLRAAITSLEELTSQSPGTPRYQRLLALCYREEARHLLRRDPDEAEKALQKAIRLLEELAQIHPKVPDYRYDLARTYGLRPPPGGRRGAVRSLPDEDRLQKALAIAENLVDKRPRIPDYQALHAQLLYQRGMMIARSRPGQEAVESIEEAVDAQTSLVRSFPDAAHYVVWLAIYRQRLANIYRHQRRNREAMALLEDTVEKLSTALTKNPDQRYLQGMLERTYRDLARIYAETGQGNKAEEARKQAGKQGEGFRRWRRKQWRRGE
jgi:serine/threonine protein kinase